VRNIRPITEAKMSGCGPFVERIFHIAERGNQINLFQKWQTRK